MKNAATNQLTTIANHALATATGGLGSPTVYKTAAEADARKRSLDRSAGFGLGDPGRSVARRTNGGWTVEGPRRQNTDDSFAHGSSPTNTTTHRHVDGAFDL